MTRKKAYGWLTLFLMLIVPLLIFSCTRWYIAFMWDVNCGQHIKRSADANTVEMAKTELGIALKYLEDHNTTEGYTTVFKCLWLPPADDVNFWYSNLKSAYNELAKITPQTRQEERGVVLLKLRQTLMDHTAKGGEEITVPSGISIFPYNVAWWIVGFVLTILALPGLVLTMGWFGTYTD